MFVTALAHSYRLIVHQHYQNLTPKLGVNTTLQREDFNITIQQKPFYAGAKMFNVKRQNVKRLKV